MPPSNKAIARKKLVIFYVLDTSGSMVDEGKIGALNEAMRETVTVLQEIASKNADAEMQIAVMEFSSGARWITAAPTFLEDFYWDDLTAGGLTDIGDALHELRTKMSRSVFLQSDTGYMVPIIIFMSDGYPTDSWEKELQKIIDEKTGNKWFKYSTKIAFALGNDADVNMLSKIVGNKEAVIQTNDLEDFKKMIKVVLDNCNKEKSKNVYLTINPRNEKSKNALTHIGFYNAEGKNYKISYNDFEKRVTMNNVKY